MHRISEIETRNKLIDPALERARWLLLDKHWVGIDTLVDNYDAVSSNSVFHCLLRDNDEVDFDSGFFRF